MTTDPIITPEQFAEALDDVRANLVLPIVGEHSSKLISFMLAHKFRRSQAINNAIAYSTGGEPAPPVFAGADRDLVLYYRQLMEAKEVLAISEIVYGKVLELRGEAENILHALQNDPLTTDQKAELVSRLDKIGGEIEEAVNVLEGLENG
jgi:hypothetical protein